MTFRHGSPLDNRPSLCANYKGNKIHPFAKRYLYITILFKQIIEILKKMILDVCMGEICVED